MEKQDLLDGSQAPITEVPPMSCMVSYRKLLHSGLNLTTEERISANILTFDQCDNSQFIGHRTLSQGIFSTRSLQILLPTQWAQESKQEEDRLFFEVIPISCPPSTFSSVPSQTFAMKIPASMMALMCLSQPEFSSPHRKSLIEGDLSSHTARKTMLQK